MDLKLNQKRTYLVGLAFMSITLFWTVYDNVIAKMLVDNFGLNQTWSGVVMALDNIFALFMLPFFGRLSDRTRTKYGRRKPFIVIGTVLAAFLIVGVSIFDFMQQKALVELGISVIKESESGQFFYTIGTAVITDPKNNKSTLMLERSAYIFKNVTSGSPGFLIGFVVVLFFVIISMGLYRSPAVSLMPDITPKPLRSKANAVINLLGAIGGGIAYLLTIFLASDGSVIVSKFGYTFNLAATGLLMLLLVAVFTITVREPEWSQDMIDITHKYNLDSLDIDDEGVDMSRKSDSDKMPKEVLRSLILILTGVVLWFFAYNAAVSKFSVYATGHLNIEKFGGPPLVATVAAAICFIPIGIISSKIGRRRMILIGIGGLTLSFFGAVFITKNSPFLMYVVMAMVGISWASINVNSYPMVVEMARHGDTGKYTGYYYTASMAAQIFTPILSGIVMDVTRWMPSLFIYSTVFAALAFIPMLFVKHGEPVRLAKEDPVETEDEE